MATTSQLKWLSTLMRFYFETSYRQGKDNTAADALPCNPTLHLMQLQASWLTPTLLHDIQQSQQNDAAIQDLMTQLQQESHPNSPFRIQQGIIKRKERKVVGADTELRHTIINEFHASPKAGHSRVQVFYKLLSLMFYWKGMKKAFIIFQGIAAHVNITRQIQQLILDYYSPANPTNAMVCHFDGFR